MTYVVEVLGTSLIRGCCRFRWWQDSHSARRVVFVRPWHCAACVEELRRSAKLQRINLIEGVPMDRVRSLLSLRRAELLDRWRRQLRAAADAGFALDPATAAVLPPLLDAADRALEKRFRPPSAAPERSQAEGRRSALQAALLSDFVFDSVLDSLPDLGSPEQRLLADALAQGSVEVLVQAAVQRETERLRKEAAPLARLAHELRNAMTAAQLSFDLLHKREQRSGAARALEKSLRQLREGLENAALDELLSRGGLRASKLALAPVLHRASADAGELGAVAKDIELLVEPPRSVLHAHADRRMLEPTLRGLLRAAVSVARRGTTIRLGAGQARNRVNVAVTVKDLNRPAARLASLPALQLARKAAKAQGGSLIARAGPGDGVVFRLNLPVQPH